MFIAPIYLNEVVPAALIAISRTADSQQSIELLTADPPLATRRP